MGPGFGKGIATFVSDAIFGLILIGFIAGLGIGAVLFWVLPMVWPYIKQFLLWCLL
jgi:hypothetical protein